MAKAIKFIIVSDTWIKGKPVAKGTTLDIDTDDRDQMATLGMLNLSGRVAEALPENVKRVEAELAVEKAREARSKPAPVTQKA